MYLFSIIIPHHNLPKLLKRALDSIPVRPEIQIIIIDDNSDPQCVDFGCFPGLNRENTTVIFDKKGGGAGYARNIGLNLADSKWIIFCDSDDFFHKDAFNHFFDYANSNYDVIFYKADCLDSETLTPTRRNGILFNDLIDDVISNEVSPRNVAFKNMAPWAKMISLSFLKKNDIIFDEIRVSEDVMFSTKIACLAESIAVSNQFAYVVTYRSGSLSHIVDEKKFLTQLDVRIRKNNYLRQQGHKPIFIAEHLIPASKISFGTFWKSFLLLLKNRMLFTGFFCFIREILNSKVYKKR